MKKLSKNFSIGFLIAAILLALSPSSVLAKTYEINFQLFHNRLQGIVQEVHIPFAKRLEAKSGGKLKVIVNDFGSISPEVTSALETGLIQMAIHAPFLEPGQHDIMENVAAMPMFYANATVASMTAQYIYDRYEAPRAQFSPDIKVAGWFCASLMQLTTTEAPVRQMSDMKGVKVVALGKIQAQLTQALGGIPTTIPLTGPGDLYVAMERGMATGIIFDLGSLITNKLNEVAKYTTLSDLATGPMYLAISRDWYNKLPLDLQLLIDEETGMKFAELNGQYEDKAIIDAGLKLKRGGQKFYVLSDREKAKWMKKGNEVMDLVIAEYKKKGVTNMRAILMDAKQYGEKLATKYAPVDFSPLTD